MTANTLANSRSSYLRSAEHQPIHWHAWGDEAFARAQTEDKPILLDIGAVWCHWCHVMDRESYEDPALAEIINEHFIAIKVDRDERPDVDARYQAAVSAISGQGGWPLTAILTPDGRPYFGGTYFPRDDRYGRPGFARVLLTMAAVWKDRREEALDSAASVMAAIEENENFSGRGGALNFTLSEKIAASALNQFDSRYGGFGTQPKFPHPAALDLMMQIACRKDESSKTRFDLLNAVSTTLLKMGRGGVYDQLAGGFHRYSVDERWIVPHFEKMLYDNSELLKNYIHAARIFTGVDAEELAEKAREIVHWLDTTMTDRERGGFYASQDADINLDDDGDYFTWTAAEARAVLSEEEFQFAAEYYDIGELGDMHHNPAKNVLHIKQTLAEIAVKEGKNPAELQALHLSVRTKLLAARSKRPTPFIDRTLYTSWNAMGISAYFEAARGLGSCSTNFSSEEKKKIESFALKSLDRLIAASFDADHSTLTHVIAYSDGHAPSGPIAGTLDDYASTIHACLDAWEATGNIHYYRTAESLAQAMITRFFYRTAAEMESGNELSGAFADAALAGEKLGALAARRRPLQDTPTPAGNPVAAAALLRLAALNARSEMRAIAYETLQTFSGIVEHFGLYVGSYGLALERLLAEPEQIVIVGTDTEAERMESVACKAYSISRTVIRLASLNDLPLALAETIGQMPPQTGPWALVCKGRTCLPPVRSVDEMKTLL
jgi:hypothetical protein